jgi:hypothetical protein
MVGFHRMAKSQDEAERHQGIDRNGCHSHVNAVVGAISSRRLGSAAQEFEARAALLQSQLDYVQAADEMDAAIGRRPR